MGTGNIILKYLFNTLLKKGEYVGWNAQRNGSKFAIFYITIAYENPNCFLHFSFHAIFKKKYLIVCLLSGSFYLSLNIMSRLKDFLDLFFRSKILLRQSETAAAAVQVLYAAVYMSVNFHVKKMQFYCYFYRCGTVLKEIQLVYDNI